MPPLTRHGAIQKLHDEAREPEPKPRMTACLTIASSPIDFSIESPQNIEQGSQNGHYQLPIDTMRGSEMRWYIKFWDQKPKEEVFATYKQEHPDRNTTPSPSL